MPVLLSLSPRLTRPTRDDYHAFIARLAAGGRRRAPPCVRGFGSTQSDPRGDLIMVQAAIETATPRRRSACARPIARLLAIHRRSFFPISSSFTFTWRRGVVHRVGPPGGRHPPRGRGTPPPLLSGSPIRRWRWFLARVVRGRDVALPRARRRPAVARCRRRCARSSSPESVRGYRPHRSRAVCPSSAGCWRLPICTPSPTRPRELEIVSKDATDAQPSSAR